jgi:hypothetical protein
MPETTVTTPSYTTPWDTILSGGQRNAQPLVDAIL